MTPENLRTLARHINTVADHVAAGSADASGAQGIADLIVDGLLVDLRRQIPANTGRERDEYIRNLDAVGDQLTEAFVNLLGRLKVSA